MDTELYVWARKIIVTDPQIIAADHAWVTNYPNPGPLDGFTLPIPVDKCYWYCWGVFHNAGDSNQNPAPYSSYSGPWPGQLKQAICICQPNVAKNENAWPHAWIEGPYGVHGVCHQVANRILWSAGKQSGERITVRGVAGWQWSWFMYGPYGYPLQPWMWPLQKCEKDKGVLEGDSAPASVTNQLIESTIGPNVPEGTKEAIHKARSEMLEEKKAFDLDVTEKKISGWEFANKVNHLLTQTARKIAGLLSQSDYTQLFGIAPRRDLHVQLVDPKMALEYIPAISKGMNG